MCLCLYITPTHNHTLTLSHYHTLTLTHSHYHTLTQSHPHTITLSHTHTHTQVSRVEHEALAKRYDQAIAQVRLLQHNKEQDRQDIEGRYIDSLKKCVCVCRHICLRVFEWT